MQQFATSQTSIAASKIPFEDAQRSSSASRDAASSSFEGASQKSAFEEALAKHESSSQVSAKNARDESNDRSQRSDSLRRQRDSDDANKAADLKQQERIDAANAKDTAKQQTRHRLDDAQTNKQQSKEQAEQDSKSNALKGASAKDAFATQGNDPKQGNEMSDNLASAQQNSLDSSSVAKSKEQALNADNIAGDFDWVSYVNQVKDLSGASDIIPNDLHVPSEDSAGDIFAQTIASLNQSSDPTNTANAVDANIVNATMETEFLEINLSQDELAALINAAGGNSEEQLGLNSEAMAELDKAIAKLLNQLVSKDEGEASAKKPIQSDVELADTAKDADLLKDLLQASTLDKEQKLALARETSAQETAVQEIAFQGSPAQQNVAQNTSADKLAANTQSAKANAEALAVNSTSESAQAIENTLVSADISDVQTSKKQASDIDLAGIKNHQFIEPKPLADNVEKLAVLSELEAELVVSAAAPVAKPALEKTDKLAEMPLFVPVDKASSKKQAELLAKLPPAAESSAIENIATRVESVIADLKTEGKSTEFIAALQSGVKEMKEQMKQGREPGIDLKALVTDALAQADVQVSASKEPALDKQLNQVTNILAAATSLTQANQQQNYLNTGLTEVQGMKEMSQQQLESTRLAQQTVVNEKAVNIFKPEGQQQLAEKVRWMANTRNLSAEIRLDPPDLGGMNIKVSLSGDSAAVSFVVQSQQAREALEQAAPRLREMLEEQGIELGQSSIEQDSSGSNQGSDQDTMANNSSASNNLAQQSQDSTLEGDENGQSGNDAVIEQRISGGRIGGIDYYA